MVEDLQIVLLNKPPASALPVRLLADQLNQQIFTPSQPSIASELIVGFTEKALAQKYYSALPIHCFHNDLGIHSLDHNYRGLCQTGAALYFCDAWECRTRKRIGSIPLASLKENRYIVPSDFPREG